MCDNGSGERWCLYAVAHMQCRPCGASIRPAFWRGVKRKRDHAGAREEESNNASRCFSLRQALPGKTTQTRSGDRAAKWPPPAHCAARFDASRGVRDRSGAAGVTTRTYCAPLAQQPQLGLKTCGDLGPGIVRQNKLAPVLPDPVPFLLVF